MTIVDRTIGADRRRAAWTIGAIVIVERLCALAEIGPGAEGPSLAGDDYRADPVIGIGGVECGDKFKHHLLGEGVEFTGPVEGDYRDAIGDSVADLGEVHLHRLDDRHVGEAAAFAHCLETPLLAARAGHEPESSSVWFRLRLMDDRAQSRRR